MNIPMGVYILQAVLAGAGMLVFYWWGHRVGYKTGVLELSLDWRANQRHWNAGYAKCLEDNDLL